MSALQSTHTLRARRWARTRFTLAVMRNGSTPMLSRREMVARRVVRVQRREHEVARERGLDRDLGGLEVADLADHDDVRVLPQERAQRGGEVEADLVVHLHLVDAVEVVLDRVFGGGDVDVDLVQLARAPSRASSSCRSPWGP
jgi:hypothetical protein